MNQARTSHDTVAAEAGHSVRTHLTCIACGPLHAANVPRRRAIDAIDGDNSPGPVEPTPDRDR